MELKIPYGQVTNREEAYNAVRGVITPEFIGKLKVQPDFYYSENESIAAKGKGFEFELRFNDDSVEVYLKLGLLFKAFKQQALDLIEKKINKVI